MFIRPATIPEGMEGSGARFRVRDPETRQFLADEGEHKPASDYWLRRLQDGGVEEVDPPDTEPRADAPDLKSKGDAP